ncbi:hypothetical protein DNK56_07520 [Streptomyces sp. AC1-42W]|nr:hypothetical protein DNK55_23925 [Streptomyces sp. AC1-42T]PZT81946.1 hypothetical protein DNK56_07520 [Streptomyces sp. AC1-42W]
MDAETIIVAGRSEVRLCGRGGSEGGSGEGSGGGSGTGWVHGGRTGRRMARYRQVDTSPGSRPGGVGGTMGATEGARPHISGPARRTDRGCEQTWPFRCQWCFCWGSSSWS